MYKKDVSFLVIFLASFSILLFYLGSSITGNVVSFDAANQITTVSQSNVNFYALITLMILFVGSYYFINRKNRI